MVNKSRTRMYCHPEFKKMIDISRIENGEQDSILFTKKLAENPELIRGRSVLKKNETTKKKKRLPSLF